MAKKGLNIGAPSFVPGQTQLPEGMPPGDMGGHDGMGNAPMYQPYPVNHNSGQRFPDSPAARSNRRGPHGTERGPMMGGNPSAQYRQPGNYGAPHGMPNGPQGQSHYGWSNSPAHSGHYNDPNQLPYYPAQQHQPRGGAPQRGAQPALAKQRVGPPPIVSPPHAPSPPTAAAAVPAVRAQPPAPVCKVIMVIGYCGSGKTTVAKAIAKSRKYEYVNLKGTGEDSKDDDTKDVEPTNDRLAVLQKLLVARKSSLSGIVLDDVIVRSRFEAHYVNTILQRHQLSINAVVILAPALSSLLARDPALHKSTERMCLHPESFELASLLEDASPTPAPIVVVGNEGSVEEVLEEVESQLKDIESRPPVAVTFPQIELMKKCTLVTDPELVDTIIKLEMEVLRIDSMFGFPYVEPNYLLDYPAFVRSAIRFKSYKVVPWVWGDKVSIIGYEGSVYVHLPSFRLVFKLEPAVVPTPMHELMKKLRSEMEGDEKDSAAHPIMFSLEASMLDDTLYISDMMLIGKTLGSKTLLHDRVKLLRSELGKLPQSGPLRLLQHFAVRDIKKCFGSCEKARGVLFVNPDGMMAGQYDSRNFLYPSDTMRTVRLRVWNGRADGARWLFDAYSLNQEVEDPIDINDEKVPIVIADTDVEAYGIDDGHIVDCVLTTDSTASPAPAKGARRAAPKQTSVFSFEKRCCWQSKPITLHYQHVFRSPRVWSTEKLFDACATIPDVPAQAVIGEKR